MNLFRVTITGADDTVAHGDLIRLSQEFPFVEWGLLMSMSRAGRPRYPSRSWLRNLISYVPARMHLSVHFCGTLVLEAMAGRIHHFSIIERVQRIQLNGYRPGAPGLVEFARMLPAYQIILQAHDTYSFIEATRDAATINRTTDPAARKATILFDPSGGQGRLITSFPVHGDLTMGYAGGLTPKNVKETIITIARRREAFSPAYWIDMESGVRTDDVFDLDKVRAVLETVAPWIRRRSKD